MKYTRQILLCWALVLFTLSPATADDIDDYVKSVMQQRHIPATSIAVVKDGVLVKAAAYGVANMEHNIAARPEMVFKIGSVSKQFIAAGIMLLVQDGKIAVNDRLSMRLPGIPTTWQDITLRHLLTHTSGLAREGPAFDPYKVQPDIEVIKSAHAIPLSFRPGEKYDYSDLGYYVLAEVIHQVSGKSWEEFLQDRIFAPLGMTATRPTNAFDIVSNRADGYVWSADKFSNAANWTALRPSGAFLSSAQDLAKWEIALRTEQILKTSSKTEMWKPLLLNDGKSYPYGFGWELDDFPPGGYTTGVPMIRHEGTIPGFRSVFARLPKQGLTIIVLTNLDRAQVDSIVAGIAVRYAPELMPAALRRWEASALK